MSPSRDPIGFALRLPFYTYVFSNPLRYNDSAGLYAIDIDITNQQPTLDLDPAPQAGSLGLFSDLGASHNVTFAFDPSKFVDDAGCCLCREIAIYQTASYKIKYEGGWTVNKTLVPDGAFPYKNTHNQEDNGRETGGIYYPCSSSSSVTHITATDDPWASLTYWGYTNYRLLSYEFEAETCLVCVEYDKNLPSKPIASPQPRPGKFLACESWGFSIWWDGTKYQGTSSPKPPIKRRATIKF